jgi:hypothetical protein
MRRPAALAAALLLVAAAPLAPQAAPPELRWRTLETTHFRVTYDPALETLARHAADRAELAYARLSERLPPQRGGPIDVLLTDHVDFSNGFAQVLPTPRIVLYAQPPTAARGLDHFNDWIDLVVVHELAHIFHLDVAGRIGRLIRRVFGRVPMAWPAFPALGTPAWSIEGLAVGLESELTGYGRGHGTFHDMVVRAAALEGRFDPYERVSATSPLWPGDQRVYIYGSRFLEGLAGRYGEDVVPRMVQKTQSAWLPPFLFFSHVGRRTIGRGFGAAWKDWRSDVEQASARLADALRADGLTRGDVVLDHGRQALEPRFAPDGARLVYARENGRSVAASAVVDLATGATRAAYRRNGMGSVAWMPDGRTLLTAELEFDGPNRIRSDLYLVGPDGRRRLTRQARLQQPDAHAAAGIVAVQGAGGTNALVRVDAVSGDVRVLVGARADVHWARPRWAPDGGRIAVARWQGGRWAVVVLDTTGAVRATLIDEPAVAAAPAWSPDGAWIVFSSDRTGIANLYAAPAAGGGLRQVTNVLGGAFEPDIAPDGGTIVYSAYGARGYRIERLPFEPDTWRDPAPPGPIAASATTPTAPAAAGAAIRHAAGASRPYAAWATARPHHWIPVGYREARLGTFVGAASSGTDLVGRHAWAAQLAAAPETGRTEGSATYAWSGLGNPILQLGVRRDWDRLGAIMLPDSTFRDVTEREDAIGLYATFAHRRWRSSAALTLGVEREWVRRRIEEAPAGVRLRDPTDRLWTPLARAGWANYRVPAQAISREDGIAAAIGARARLEHGPPAGAPRDEREVTATTSAYRSLPLGSFANHVLAARVSGLHRFGDGAAPTRLGGASGSPLDLFGLASIGQGALLLPVRGFERGVRSGTSVWSASVEYRVPLGIPGRRPRLSPLYFDRISGTLFADAGDATCSDAAAARFRSCARTADDVGGPLVSTGAELVADVGLGSFLFTRVRLGIAQPVRGPHDAPQLHLRLGSSF